MFGMVNQGICALIIKTLFYADLYHLGLANVFSSAAFPPKKHREK